MTEKTSLNKFVKENYQLISTIGIMGALSALLLNLTNFPLLAFVPLALMLVLTMELVGQFPEIEECSWRLVAFMFLIVGFFIIIGGYIFTAYITVFYQLFVFGILFGIFMIVWWSVLRRIKIPNFVRLALLYAGEVFILILSVELTDYVIEIFLS